MGPRRPALGSTMSPFLSMFFDLVSGAICASIYDYFRPIWDGFLNTFLDAKMEANKKGVEIHGLTKPRVPAVPAVPAVHHG